MIIWQTFLATALALAKKAFVIHMVYLRGKILIYSAWKVQIALFLTKKVNILKEYFDFSDVFCKESATKLSDYLNINKHIINLELNKQLFYKPIYNLVPIKLKTLKTYIETNLTNGFIQLSKSLTRAPIFFVLKADKNLYLYVDYYDLNNLTIKNKNPLFLIGELLDQLKKAKQFIQLDLISAYH